MAYTVMHSSVDGAGITGRYDTLEEAIAEADKLQAVADDREGNPYGYRYHVYGPAIGDRRYSSRPTPEWVQAEWRKRKSAELLARRAAEDAAAGL